MRHLRHGTRVDAKPASKVSLAPSPWEVTPAIRAIDWPRSLAAGLEMAFDQIRKDRVPNELDAMWELLRASAKVSAKTYRGPPQTGYPSKSSMPEAGDDITPWQQAMAYLRGEVESLPEEKASDPTPSAAEITLAEAVLDLWHHHALKTAGDKRRLKKALYWYASGQKPREIRAKTGLSPQQLSVAKRDAMRDMLEVLRRI